MRTYRASWQLAVGALAVAAAVVGVARLGWPPVVAGGLSMAVVGGATGFTWVEDGGARRSRLALLGGGWSGVFGVLFVGLPELVGSWALLVLVVAGAVSPPALEAVARALRRRHPVASTDAPASLSDRDLDRRWRQTADELHDRSTATATALRLVQERALLLDEIERRDPARAATMLHPADR